MNTQKSFSAARRRVSLRAALMVTTALTASAFAATPVLAADWTVTIGDWFNPANWSTGVPSSSDNVHVRDGGTARIQAPGAVSGDSTIGESMSGAVRVEGGGATWTTNQGIYVGYTGHGTLDIASGAVVTSNDGIIALTGSATGVATIDGAGSTWNANNFTVASSGSGTLLISNGGAVNASTSAIGFASGASGLASIDGAGSTWHTNYYFYLGYGGEGTLAISGGAAVDNQYAFVGLNAGGEGHAMVEGAGSTWNTTEDLHVGSGGQGTLAIANGGSVSDATGTIGSLAGSTGTVTVDGVGSTWHNDRNLDVGGGGDGTLTISGGAAVNDSTASVANEAGSVGHASVDGAGSSWNNSTYVVVGIFGHGTLDITNGGAVNTMYGSIGQETDSLGTVTVNGAGSTWAASENLTIGYRGQSTLAITGGGSATDKGGIIGAQDGGVGTVTVDGVGSTWANSNDLTIGDYGEGTLHIKNGGTVSDTNGNIANEYSGIGTVTVDGAGSSWVNSDALNIGKDGGNGTLGITNGGSVSDAYGVIGKSNESTGAVTVDGVGSTWATSEALIVGDGRHSVGTLNITGGATVSDTSGTVGNQTSSTGTVTVNGVGSTWTNSGSLDIGFFGVGTLDITGGGMVSSASTITIGNWAGSTGTVTVDGVGSALANTGEIYVGNIGDGTLTITDGAAVSDMNGYIGWAGGTGGVTVNGVGSTWTNTGRINVGTGALSINNGGVVNVVSLFTGINPGASATITVDGSGSSLSGGGDLNLGYSGAASLTVSNGANASFNSIYVATDYGSSSAINVGAAAGASAVAAGTLDVDRILFGAGAGTLIFNHTNTDYNFSAKLARAGAIRQIGSGSTILSGDSTDFTGTTSVEGGALIVNGTLGGTLSVGAARLGGVGTVRNVTLGNGSIIAPGNSVGTLNVAGDLTFGAGSTYQVDVDPDHGTNDLIHVAGAAYLNNAAVEHVGTIGNYPWYAIRTILTADDGVNGTFGSVTSNYAFLTPSLSYDAQNVRMTLLRNDITFTSVAGSPNQSGVAGAASALGLGNPIYDQIMLMTADEARTAFNALSGEAYGSTGSAAIGSVQQIRSVLQARMQMFSGNSQNASGGVQVASLGDFVPSAAAFAGDDAAVWGQVFGTKGVNDASANAAKLDRRSSGFLGGADRSVGEVSRIGVALGYSRSDFDVSARSSSGDSDNFHVAGYAATKLGAIDLGSTLSYSFGRAEAKRNVIVGGLTNNLSAEYNTHTFQASVEAGTDIGLRSVVLTPFAGLAATYVRTDSFTETGGPAALAISASENTTGTSSLGLRISHQAGKVTLTGSSAWHHSFGDIDPTSRVAFASTPAASFAVRGAPVSEDALAVDARINLALTDSTTLSFGYAGEFASDARDQGLRSEIRVKF